MEFLRNLHLLIYAVTHMPDLKTVFISAGAWGANPDKASLFGLSGIQNALTVRKLPAKRDHAPNLYLLTYHATNFQHLIKRHNSKIGGNVVDLS
jgi:hypothetical protein